MPCSQGQRSSSVSGTPLCIFSTLDGGWNQSPSSKIQFSRWASIDAIVLLPQPETPITTTTDGLLSGEAGLCSGCEPRVWRERRDGDLRRGAAADVRLLRRLIMSVRPVVARDRNEKVRSTQQGEHSADAGGVNGSISRTRASLHMSGAPVYAGRRAKRHAPEDAPILPSVPLRSRAILARCMIHSSSVSSANSTVSGRSPMSHSANGVAALATSAASEE